MRPAHILTPNRRTGTPNSLIFIDTETRQVPTSDGLIESLFRLGVAHYVRLNKAGDTIKEDHLNFDDITTFWKWVYDKTTLHHSLWLMAHNLAFDLPVLKAFTTLSSTGWKLTTLITSGGVTILKWRRDKTCLTAIDSFNYFKGSLDEMGNTIGISKLSMPAEDAPLQEWYTYCSRDVAVLQTYVLQLIRFVRDNDLGHLASTAAGQTMAAFRHKFMHDKIYFHDNEHICKLERAGYHGGRSECFFIGELSGEFHILDIHSAYPAVMLDNYFPTNLVASYKQYPVHVYHAFEDCYCWMCDVDLETDEPVYPKRINGKLCFPVGRFRTVLSTPELRYAMSHYHLRKIHLAALYSQAKLFTDYIDFFWHERQKYKQIGNKPWESLCKLMLNSFYGKWGQRGRRWETIRQIPDTSVYTGKTYDTVRKETVTYRCINGNMQVLKDDGESQNSFPAISAHVTAYQRVKLWEIIKEAGVENVLYTDTDSVVVTSQGKHRLENRLHPSRLGELGEQTTFSEGRINAPKDYRFGLEIKLKGVRHNAVKVGQNRFVQEEFVHLDAAWGMGVIDRALWRTREKTISRSYDKGIVTPSGEVLPLVLAEW